MTWADLAPLLTQSGIFTAAMWLAFKLHASAVNAHKARADDWRVAAAREAARADEREKQLDRVLEAVTTRTAGTS